MKFLLMIIDDEPYQSRLSESELRVMIDEVRAVENAITAKGQMLDSRALRPSKEAATVRMRDGEISVIDGPFVETREVLGGYFLIECASREEAIDWARKFPLQSGAIEVRPVWEMS